MNLAFVFPGQGSQYVGMAKDIHDAFPVARETFREASEVLGFDIAHVCFFGPPEELNKTFRTQPCLLTASVALCRVLAERGMRPSIVAGHSLGEYSALVAAGALSFADAVRVAEKRGQLMQEAVPVGRGLMAAILGLDTQTVVGICSSVRSGYVSPANYNCPGQIVIAGEKEAVMEAIELSKSAGAKKAIPLAVSAPSHCRLMDDASRHLSLVLDEVPFSDPVVPVINNADAMALTDRNQIKTSLVRQIRVPLLWEDSVRVIIGSGITIFLEVGPGKVLSGLIKRIDSSVSVFSIGDVNSLDAAVTALEDLSQ